MLEVVPALKIVQSIALGNRIADGSTVEQVLLVQLIRLKSEPGMTGITLDTDYGRSGTYSVEWRTYPRRSL